MNLASTLTVAAVGDTEVVMTRRFRAARQLVWETLTKPEYLKRWLFGPDGWRMTVCEDEQKVGGTFRYSWSNADGAAMSMHGVIREFVPPKRVVRTETFDFGCEPQGGEQLATMVLTEADDATQLTLTVVFPSKAARDGMLASGMEHGVAAGYSRLDDVLASIPSA